MYIYTSELFGEKLRKIFTVVSFNFYVIGGISVHLFSMWRNYFGDYIWISVISIGLFSISYWLFVETPFYYFQRGNIKGLSRCLERICQCNFEPHQHKLKMSQIRLLLEQLPKHRPDPDPLDRKEPLLDEDRPTGDDESPEEKSTLIRDLKPAQQESSDKSLLKSFFEKKNLKRFVLVMIIHCTGYLVFGMGVILGKDLGIDNIYLCGLLLTIPKFFGHVVMGNLVNRFRTKTLNIWINCIVGLLAGVLLTMNLIHNAKESYQDRSIEYRIVESGRADQSSAF